MRVSKLPEGEGEDVESLWLRHCMTMGPTLCLVPALAGKPYSSMPTSSSSQDVATLSISSLLPASQYKAPIATGRNLLFPMPETKQ